MIRTFLFDMGNVLVRFSHELMCEQMGALCGLTGDEVRGFLLEDGLQWEFERGRISPEEFHIRFQESAGRRVDFDELNRAGSDIFQLNEPMPALLRALKSRGHRLVLLSNTSLAHFDWVRTHFDVLEPFDDYVTSYQVGAIKPEPAIFERALELIRCEPAECFYTDDIPKYVDKGRSYGLQAEVFTDAESLRGHLAQRGVEV